MPVMGPNQDYAYQLGDKITDEVLELLKSKSVERPSELLPFGVKFAKEWDALEKKLRETIKEMVWTDHCASF